MVRNHCVDPGPDVIQVVLTPRHFLSPNSSMQNQQHPQTLSNIHPTHYLSHVTSNEDALRSMNTLTPNSSSMFASSVSNATQIQAHQLRELVRERLIAEDIRLSAPPYTIPTVSNIMF